jgi:hypothetical protein
VRRTGPHHLANAGHDAVQITRAKRWTHDLNRREVGLRFM